MAHLVFLCPVHLEFDLLDFLDDTHDDGLGTHPGTVQDAAMQKGGGDLRDLNPNSRAWMSCKQLRASKINT